MKRRVVTRRQREVQTDNQPSQVNADGRQVEEDFYEAVPAASSDYVYRDEPDVIDRGVDSDRALSGWAVIGLIILALAVLFLLFGGSRALDLTPATNTPTEAPATTQLNQ
jgi:hypothetical protein